MIKIKIGNGILFLEDLTSIFICFFFPSVVFYITDMLFSFTTEY